MYKYRISLKTSAGTILTSCGYNSKAGTIALGRYKRACRLPLLLISAYSSLTAGSKRLFLWVETMACVE